jgi:peptidoglycan/xylan/chitin deacetylase (PgdA/CDA1 family)
MLEGVGATVRRVSPDAADADPGSVLVVAATPCLSAPARRALQSAVRKGRGVIFTGLSGVRDGGCREAGFGLLADLAGAARADTVRTADAHYITVPSGSPLALDIPPGARIELKPAPHVAVRRPGRDAYYSDRDLNPLPTDQTALVDGAIVHDLTNGRRVVYFGFEVDALPERAWERAMMGLLVRNAVALAAGVALASPDAWPSAYRAAAVVAQDVEDEFENAQLALDTLRALKVPGTYFVVSDLAKRHEALTRGMASGGEVGTHTENHGTLGGTEDVQRRRLATTQRDLTTMLGQPVRGMRPPEERFDQASLRAWQEAGGTYVFGANDGRTPSPEVVRVGDAPFVLIGRTVDDDFLTVRRANIREPVRLAADQLLAFAKVRELGGLYIMSYHSNMLARTTTVGALGIVARVLKADTTVWLTTAGNVADWWLIRHRMETTVRREADGALTLTVRNGAPVASPAASVTVTLPRGARATMATDSDLLQGQPGTTRVRIPPLAAGGTHTTRIILEGAAHAR